MSEDEAERVFEPFYRSLNHYALNPTGVGVGLSICKQICQRLGGDIQVMTEPNIGSKFVFTMEVFNDSSKDEAAVESGNCYNEEERIPDASTISENPIEAGYTVQQKDLVI